MLRPNYHQPLRYKNVLLFFIFLSFPQISLAKKSSTLVNLFDSAMMGDTSTIIKFNNYLIRIQEEKIARSQRAPQLDLEMRTGFSDHNRNGSSQTSDAGLTFFMPIYDFQKAIAQDSARVSADLSKIESEAQKQNFAQIFLEAFLRLSEKKSRYFFGIAKNDFLKRFYLKIQKDSEKLFKERHPDVPFNESKVLVLRLIRQELEEQDRTMKSDLLDYVNEKNFIEKSLVGEKIPEAQLLHPFLKIKSVTETHDELVNRIRRDNLSLKALLAGVRVADLKLLAASKLWLPTVGLYGEARMGTISAAGASTSYTETGGGIAFRLRLSNRAERAAKEEIARLERVNKQAEYDGLFVDHLVELHRLRNGLDTQKELIASLLVSYRESKETLELFLGDNSGAILQQDILEPATIPEKRAIVESHFRVAEKLVVAQHNLLLLDLRTRLITGQMNRIVVDNFGRNLLVDCRDFKEFLELEKVLNP